MKKFALRLSILTILLTVLIPCSSYAEVIKDQVSSVTGYGGAVATEDPDASRAAITILNKGGNAIDAAIAAAAAQGVTRPYSGGIGGGGVMLVYLAEEDRYVSIDHRSAASQTFGPDTFVNPKTGSVYPRSTRISSGASTSVPGAVKAWEEILEQYGTMSLAQVLQPAIHIAENGFLADSNYVSETRSNASRFRLFESTKDVFLNKSGEVPEEGSIIKNPDLARTYRLIAEHGSDIFYEGEIAEAIIKAVNSPPVVRDPEYSKVSSRWESEFGVLDGEMTLDDLKNYEVITREPTKVEYHDYEVYGIPPSTSGGVTVGETLNILEPYDLESMPKAQALHYYLEASRYAFADRHAYLGDPDFVEIPVEGLLSKGFAEERRRHIRDDEAAIGYVARGNPWPYEEDPDLWPEDPYFMSDQWDTSKFSVTEEGASIDMSEEGVEITFDEPPQDYGTSFGKLDPIMDEFTDGELLMSFRLENPKDNQNRRLRLWFRADDWNASRSTIVNDATGVEINTKNNTLSLKKGSTLLDIINHKWTDDWVMLKVRAEGNQLKARIWEKGTREPSNWQLETQIDEKPGKVLMGFHGLAESTLNGKDSLRIGELSINPLSSSTSLEDEEMVSEEEYDDVEESTIHLAVSDDDGNIVSYTNTIVSIGGNGIVVPGYGFLLNNALYALTSTNPSHPNSPKPGMRSLSSMSPTLVMKDGKPVMTVGAPGNDTIITTVLQIVLNQLEFKMSLSDAIDEPRISQRNKSHGLADYEHMFLDEYRNKEFENTIDELKDMGHEFNAITSLRGIGAATGIEFLPNGQVRPATESMRRGGGSAMVQSFVPLPLDEQDKVEETSEGTVMQFLLAKDQLARGAMHLQALLLK
jgi:gamma-glutamyltranspeptidase